MKIIVLMNTWNDVYNLQAIQNKSKANLNGLSLEGHKLTKLDSLNLHLPSLDRHSIKVKIYFIFKLLIQCTQLQVKYHF